MSLSSETSTAIWLADTNGRVVYANRALRRQVGVTLETMHRHVIGTHNLQGKDGEMVSSFRVIRGRRILAYSRRLNLDGNFVGIVGSLVDTTGFRNPKTEDLPVQAPLVPPFHPPKIAFESCGVLLNHVQAYLELLGNNRPYRHYSEVKDLDEYFTAIGNLARAGCVPWNVLSPPPGVLDHYLPFPGVDIETIEDRLATGRIRGRFVCAQQSTPAGWLRCNYLETFQRLRQCGIDSLTSVNLGDSHTKSKAVLGWADYLLEDDPEEWVSYLFHGVMAFLIRRPWNLCVDPVRCPLVVFSTDEFLEKIGVEPRAEAYFLQPERQSLKIQ